MNDNVLSVMPLISSLSPESIGINTKAVVSSPSFNSAAWPSANLAMFVPFTLRRTTLIKKLFTANGSNASQTRDVGIYNSDGTLIIAIGSTAGSGTSTLQAYDITDTILGPGSYYMAMSSSGTTNAFIAAALTALQMRSAGIFQMASAFPLPATATFAAGTQTAGNWPLFGLSTVVTV